MNNRYLYRAKHVHAFDVNKKYDGWVYGYLSCENYIYSPIFGAEKLIDPNTICQCTGLKDKNGKLIWENDIIKYHFGDAYAPIKYGEYQSCFDSTSTGHIGFYVDWRGTKKENMRKDLGYWINMIGAEVVGNIFNNPDLLEVDHE